MTTNTTSRPAGIAVGSAIGSTAAHTVHFVVVALTATGRFGADVVTGTATGYAATAAQRSRERLARGAARLAAQQPTHAIAVETV